MSTAKPLVFTAFNRSIDKFLTNALKKWKFLGNAEKAFTFLKNVCIIISQKYLGVHWFRLPVSERISIPQTE